MASKLADLKPNSLWKHFEECLKIPHGSENETALGDYIIAFAEKINLPWQRDKTGNVLVTKPASSGYEGSIGVILQGHLDMVCEKNSDLDFDFTKDAIEPVRDGDWIHAKGTTLGADNGIGNCASLAIMEDDSMVHPPLEFLFTVEEETGLKGAGNLEPGFLKGKRLLNLDSEDEGEFTIGCAGGSDSRIYLQTETENANEGTALEIKLFGFEGGHSGVDINLGRGNAIKLLARLLWEIGRNLPFQTVKIEGGNLRNAIPREAWAHVVVPSSKKEKFIELGEKAFSNIKDEFQATDPNAAWSCNEVALPTSCLTEESGKTFINLLNSLLHGVVAMHPEMEGLVETSNNLAVVRSHAQKAEIICSTRSSTASALEAAQHTLQSTCELAGAEIILEDGYPGWKPNLQSPLLQILKDVYKDMFHKEAEISAIHAGLECGIIGDKFPGMDMISFGPTIKFPHSPSEKVHIESVEKFWSFLVRLLEKLK